MEVTKTPPPLVIPVISNGNNENDLNANINKKTNSLNSNIDEKIMEMHFKLWEILMIMEIHSKN